MIVFEREEVSIPLPMSTILVKEGEELLGYYLLVPHSKEMYEVHTHFYVPAYGSTVQITKNFLQWLFKTEQHLEVLITMVPTNNLLAKRLTLKCGLSYCGTIPKSFKSETMIDQEVFRISRGEVLCQ